MSNPDAIRLRHMREEAAVLMEMVAGRTRDDLDGIMMLRMAITRCLESLGEAASKVTPATR